MVLKWSVTVKKLLLGNSSIYLFEDNNFIRISTSVSGVLNIRVRFTTNSIILIMHIVSRRRKSEGLIHFSPQNITTTVVMFSQNIVLLQW